MRNIEYEVDLSRASYTYEACMQEDDLMLKINVYNKGIAYSLTKATAKLTWIRPDGTPVENKKTTINGNTIVFNLDKNYTNISGKANFDISITKEGTITTFPLEIFIVEKVLQSEKVNNTIIDLVKVIKVDEVIYELVDGINHSLKELQAQFDDVIANVTNGNESATNSEIVTARAGLEVLNSRLDKIESGERIRQKAFSSCFVYDSPFYLVEENPVYLNNYIDDIQIIGEVGFSSFCVGRICKSSTQNLISICKFDEEGNPLIQDSINIHIEDTSTNEKQILTKTITIDGKEVTAIVVIKNWKDLVTYDKQYINKSISLISSKCYVSNKLISISSLDLNNLKENLIKTINKLSKDVLFGAEGKNLFNKNTVTNGYYVDCTDGKIRALAGVNAGDYISVKANVPYYLSGTRQQFALYNLDREFVSGKTGFSNVEKPIITPTVDGYIRLTVKDEELDSVQLEEGTELTAYEDYNLYLDNNSFSDKNINYLSEKLDILNKIINEINNKDNKIVIGKYGKNLFNKETATPNSYTDYTDGIVRTLSTCYASDYIDIHSLESVKVNGTKQQYAVYNENKEFLRGGTRVDEYIKQEDEYYIRLTIANAEIDSVQLEEGKESTTYEPFGIKLLNDNFSSENLKYIKANLPSDVKNIVTVKQDGSGDFKTIFEAVTSITNASEDNQYWVYVYEGTYHMNEEILQFSDFTKYPKGLFLPDYVHLIGIGDKRKIILDCTLADDIGLTISTNFSTLNLNKSNIVRNVTVKAKNCRYAIHDETNGVVENYIRELDNCDVIHEGNAEGLWQWDCAYGIGFGGGSKFKYRNCLFETKSKTVGNASFGGHNWDNQSDYADFEFEGCNFLHSGLLGTENEVAFRMGATESQYQDRFTFKGCNFNTGKIRLKKETTAESIEFVLTGYANKHIDLDYPDTTPTTLPSFIATES